MKRLCSLLVLGSLSGCGDFSVNVLPLELMLTVDTPNLPVGEFVGYRYQAQGRGLLGLIVDYGDGVVDSLSFAGAQTAAGTCGTPTDARPTDERCRHAYELPGTYVVTGRLEDVTGEVVEDEMVIEVMAAP